MGDDSVFIECDVCDAREELYSEVTERTLEDEGWYLGDVSILCPEHSEAEE